MSAASRCCSSPPTTRESKCSRSLCVFFRLKKQRLHRSYDFLLHKLNSDWELPFESLLPDAFADGALEGVEVLLIPHCTFATVFQALGAEGRSAIAQWVESGGHVVGWQGGAQLLSEMELSMTQFEPAESSCPGSFFRLMLDATHPLAAGVGSEVFMYYRSTLPVMRSFQHRIVGYGSLL